MVAPSSLDDVSRPGDSGGGALEILVLDDMETDRMRLKRLCSRAGLTFRATEASNLVEMRNELSAKAFDVIFLDYALGIGTGLDAIELVKSESEQNSAVMIMVSTLDDLELALQAMRLGCADYINKEELSVEAIRKSLALAFERRLLLFSLQEASTNERETRALLGRLARTTGAEICSVVSAALENTLSLGGKAEKQNLEHLSSTLRRLDGLCNDLRSHLCELSETGTIRDGTTPGPRPVEDETA